MNTLNLDSITRYEPKSTSSSSINWNQIKTIAAALGLGALFAIYPITLVVVPIVAIYFIGGWVIQEVRAVGNLDFSADSYVISMTDIIADLEM